MTKKWVNIADVLFFQEGPGVRNTQYTTSGVKLLNVANLVDGKVDLSKSDRYISEEEAYGKYRHFLCDDGDFVIASSGIKVEYIDKKMGFVDASMLPLCMNTSTIRFKVLDENQLRIRYFMYYLKSKHFKEQLTKQITGSAQLNYGPSHLKKMIMPLIDITVQDEIISCMDKLQSIIETRQRELIELDRLMKARFVELFECGDHEIVKASDVCDFITKGTTPPTGEITEEYENGKIPFLKVYNLSFTGEMLFDENPQYILAETHNGKLARSKVYPNDVLMNIVGPPLGKFTLVTDEFEEWNINQAIAIFRAKERILPRFLLHALMQPKVLEPFIGQAVGIRQQNLSLEQCRNLQFPLPSLEEQKSFVEFAEQLDKLQFDTMTFAPIYAIINLYLHTYFYQGRR